MSFGSLLHQIGVRIPIFVIQKNTSIGLVQDLELQTTAPYLSNDSTSEVN